MVIATDERVMLHVCKVTFREPWCARYVMPPGLRARAH